MIWRSTVMIVLAFVAAGLTVWYSPSLLDMLGLGEFAFVGQICLSILVLSVLEVLFARTAPADGLPGNGSVLTRNS